VDVKVEKGQLWQDDIGIYIIVEVSENEFVWKYISVHGYEGRTLVDVKLRLSRGAHIQHPFLIDKLLDYTLTDLEKIIYNIE
jgi:hypothetical protein